MHADGHRWDGGRLTQRRYDATRMRGGMHFYMDGEAVMMGGVMMDLAGLTLQQKK